jgi:hypothetical protein
MAFAVDLGVIDKPLRESPSASRFGRDLNLLLGELLSSLAVGDQRLLDFTNATNFS